MSINYDWYAHNKRVEKWEKFIGFIKKYVFIKPVTYIKECIKELFGQVGCEPEATDKEWKELERQQMLKKLEELKERNDDLIISIFLKENWMWFDPEEYKELYRRYVLEAKQKCKCSCGRMIINKNVPCQNVFDPLSDKQKMKWK